MTREARREESMAFATTKVLRAAERRVRERIQESPATPLREVQATAVQGKNVGVAPVLAQELANLVGIRVEQLSLDTPFREYLRVHQDELPSDVRVLMPKIGLEEVVDPFAFDLLDYAERKFRELPERAKRKAFSPTPRSEDEWIDRIMGMTAREFLQALT